MSNPQNDSMTLAYVRLRLQDPQRRQNKAALEAGFSGGRPSPAARRIWQCVEMVLEQPEICEELERERQRLEAAVSKAEAQLAKAREKLAAQDDWQRACDAVAETLGCVSGC